MDDFDGGYDVGLGKRYLRELFRIRYAVILTILILSMHLLGRSADRQITCVANDGIHSLNLFAQTVR